MAYLAEPQPEPQTVTQNKAEKVEAQPKNEQLTAEETQQVESESKKAAGTSSPIESLMENMMGTMGRFLGSTKGSKLTGKLGVNVPIATGCYLKLSLQAEQERKDDKTQISNQLQGGIGMEMSIKGLTDSAVSAEFYTFLGAESADFGTTAGLLSYGFYKSGRVAADKLNDWGAGIASGGLSVGESAAIYYGLNYMYGNSDLDLLDQAKDDDGAEENIAKVERELFSLDDNDPNKNEVSFGGGAKGEVNIGDDAFKGEVDAMLSTTINKESLKKTGVIGTQKNLDFFEDYDIGGSGKFALKFASSFKAKSFSGRKNMVMNFIKNEEGKATGKGNRKWKFENLDFEMAYGLSIGTTKFSKKELVQQFVQLGVGYFNTEKELSNTKDSVTKLRGMDKAASSSSIYKQVSNAIDQAGGALALDAISGVNGGPVKSTDKLEVLLKISSKGEATPELTFQIVRTTTKEVDLEVMKGEVVDYTPIIGFTFKA